MRRWSMVLALVAGGCGKGDAPPGDSGLPNTGSPSGTGSGTTSGGAGDYAFESRFAEGSSVVYTGQTARQLLILDLKTHVGGLTARVDGGWFPVAGDVTEELDFYFSFDGASAGDVPFLLVTDPPPLQATYGEISTTANLVGKVAGNDPEGQHRDWATDLVGWDDPAVTGPESLVRHWFAQLDAAAVDRSNGTIPLDPNGAAIPAVYLTAEGQDLQQLLEKFLHGAVSFSQATDDYLDDDLPGKGLRADNTAAEDGQPYTALEHGWDEGFAYFGASRDYHARSDADLTATGAHDSDGDGAIDLGSELSWGASLNAAKRDDGAVSPTDFTQQAWDGFRDGRALIVEADGELSPEEFTELTGYRDRAVAAWEQAIAATVVHYVNEVLVDMGKFGTADYVFADHAKHWSEMKGFSLAFQFNPRSPLSDADFAELHARLGQAPVLPAAGDDAASAYRDDLRAARDLIGSVYGFDAANLGGADGTGGW